MTGWSLGNVRRRLAQAARRRPGDVRKVSARGRRYSYDALKVLQRVWAASGGQCGKYLAACVPLLLDLLQARGEPALRAPLHVCRAGRAGGDGRGDH